MNIGDVFFSLRGDGGPLLVDAKKAANAAGLAAGQTLNQRISAGLGKGLGVGAFAGLAVGAFATVASVQGVVNILKDATAAALADEESVNRLGASLRTNIPNWNGDTRAIEQRIMAGQRLGFADETLRDSLTVLVGATHDVAKAQHVQAVAMDLARFKGVDLQTASEALIKVEAGVYRSLKSLGIVLKDGATQTEALAAVEKVAKGQAEAYAKTNAGKLAASQIQVNEAMEKFGAVTMPVVVAVTQAAAGFVSDLAKGFTDLRARAADAEDPLAKDLAFLAQLWELGNKPINLDKLPFGWFGDLLSTARGDPLGGGSLRQTGEKAGDQLVSGLVGNLGRTPALDAAAAKLFAGIPAAVAAQVFPTRQAILDLLHAAADQIAKGRKNIDDEITALNELAKKPDINLTTELEKLLRARTSPALLTLLKSPDREKRTAAKVIAADLDETIALLKPRPGIMDSTSKALIAELEKSTNPELAAFAGWFEAQLQGVTAAKIAASPGIRNVSPNASGVGLASRQAAISPQATADAIHKMYKDAIDSADPFIQNDARKEGHDFAVAAGAAIGDARSKAIVDSAMRLLFSGVDITRGLFSGLFAPVGNRNAYPPSGSLTGAASGMPYVARDMPLYVHQGEAILTTPQAAAWRAGGTQSIYIDHVTVADANDEMSVIDRLRFLSMAQ